MMAAVTRSRRKTAEAVEADEKMNRAFLHCMQLLYDVPAVLRRQKPASALVGSMEVAGLVFGVVSSSLVMDQWNELRRRMAATMYLRDVARFRHQTVQLVVVMLAFSLLSQLTSSFSLRLAQVWRSALTKHLHREYLRGDGSSAFYRLLLAGQTDADLRICSDISSLTTQLASFTYNSLYYTFYGFTAACRLALRVRVRYVFFCLGWVWCVQTAQEWLVPARDTGEVWGQVGSANGEYRGAHARVQKYSESIYTLRGAEFEKQSLLQAFGVLQSKYRAYYRQSRLTWLLYSGVSTTVLQPAFQSLLVEFPFAARALRPEMTSATDGLAQNALILSDITFQLQCVTRCMTQVGGLFQQWRTLYSLSASAQRVTELLDECEAISAAHGATSANKRIPDEKRDAIEVLRLDRVTVTVPEREGAKCSTALIRELTCEIQAGENLLVVGPSGSGKSSLVRALAGLWPISAGTINPVPDRIMQQLLILPTTPYCPPTGSLSALLTYPACCELSQGQMQMLLTFADLRHLRRRNTADWSTTLSLGEKQRVAVARLVHHRPQFAVLDECFSTLSEEMTSRVFHQCKKQGTTIVACSTAHSLSHTCHCSTVLSLGGQDGAWSLQSTAPGTSLGADTKEVLQQAVPVPAPDWSGSVMTSSSQPIRPAHGLTRDSTTRQIKVMPKRTRLRRLLMIWQIMVPTYSLRNRGFMLLSLNVLYTLLSVLLTGKVLSALPGQLQAAAIRGDHPAYMNLLAYATLLRALSVLNGHFGNWASHSLSLEWKAVLTTYLTNAVLDDDTGCYYALQHLDKRILDMDVRICQDCASCASYMNSFIFGALSPISSAVLCTRLLIKAQLPLSAIAAVYAYAVVGSGLVKFGAPDIAGFGASSSGKEGRFRAAHQRLIANAEAVALLGGEQHEREVLDTQLDSVVLHAKQHINRLWIFNSVNSFFTSYLPSVVTGWMRMNWSLRYGTVADVMNDHGGTGLSATGDYISNLILQGFTAIAGVLNLHTTFQTLLGPTHRVTDLVIVMEEIKSERKLAANELLARCTQQRTASHAVSAVDGDTDSYDSLLQLDAIGVQSPDGRSLFSSGVNLSVEARPGYSSTYIVGNTGCGKSSVFRVLAGVWLPCSGTLNVPQGRVAFAPQQTLGTARSISLLEYLLYPELVSTVDASTAVGKLGLWLKDLRMWYLVDRYGWEDRRHWDELLSLGEQQALCCVRMLYHLSHLDSMQENQQRRPKWAVMDECTSAMAVETKALLFALMERNSINVVAFCDKQHICVRDTGSQVVSLPT